MLQVFVCGFNPVIPNILASGYHNPRSSYIIRFSPRCRSKDAVVKLWDVPESAASQSSRTADQPVNISSFSKADAGDLTSLHWNHDGTLLAVASYDSVLRICDLSGNMYFEHTQHQVSASMWLRYLHSLLCAGPYIYDQIFEIRSMARVCEPGQHCVFVGCGRKTAAPTIQCTYR